MAERIDVCAGCPVTRAREGIVDEAAREMDKFNYALYEIGKHPLAMSRLTNKVSAELDALATKLGITSDELADFITDGLTARFFAAQEDVEYAVAEVRHVQDVCGNRGLQEAAIASSGLKRSRDVLVCPHTYCQRPDCTDSYDLDGITVQPANIDD